MCCARACNCATGAAPDRISLRPQGQFGDQLVCGRHGHHGCVAGPLRRPVEMK